MKYVILKATFADMDVSKAFPFIFSEHLTHSEIAKAMKRHVTIELRPAHVEVEVHSAGFCNVTKDGFVCVRGSETLNIKKEETRCADDERTITFNDSMSIML